MKSGRGGSGWLVAMGMLLVVFLASQAFVLSVRSDGSVHQSLSVILQGIAIVCGVALLLYTVFLLIYGRPLRVLEAVRRDEEKAWLFSPTAETKAALRTLSNGAIDRVPLVLMLQLKSPDVIVRAPTKRGPHLVIPAGAIQAVEVGQTFNVTTQNECLVLVISTADGAPPVRLPLLLQRDTAPRIFTMTGQTLQEVRNAVHTSVVHTQP